MGRVGQRRTNDPRRRLTVAQAADQLGISVDAMRARVKRRTVATEREGGRVYVLLDAAQDNDQDAPQTDRTAELISTLREQLQAERQAHAEARRLLAAALERIPPQIEAPSEARESPETVEEEPERAEPRSGGPAAQGATERPWWRRMFGS